MPWKVPDGVSPSNFFNQFTNNDTMKTKNFFKIDTLLASCAAIVLIALTVFGPLAFADEAVAWGYNGYGQTDVPAGSDIIAVSGGQYTSLELRSNGTISAHGYTGYGIANVPALPAGVTYTAIAAGDLHGVALRSDGNVVGWGYNGYSQNNIPALPAGMTYIDVAAGWRHTLLLRSDGQAIGIGYNSSGSLNLPVLPAGVTYTKLDGGQSHSIGLRSDGHVEVAGDATYGGTPPALPAGVVYTDIAAGQYHSLALRSDGQVVAWGQDNSGSTNVPALPAGITYTDVAAGQSHSLALRSDGQLVSFGNNGNGQANVTALPVGYIYSGLGSLSSALHSLVLRRSLVTVTLNGAEEDEILVGESYADPGATATDENGNNLVVSVTGLVDGNTPGEYSLTYTATDANGIPGFATRYVTVVKKLKSDLWLAMMPSYSQNPAYANVTINDTAKPITVWGRAWNGTPPYTYDLDFGDGSAHYTGTTSDTKFIGTTHVYTSSGTKTATLTVTDAAGKTESRSAKIRVLLASTHDDRINMAIEKGLIQLYQQQTVLDDNRVYWNVYGWNNQLSSGPSGATVLAFEENGHLPDYDDEEWIYSETVRRGLNHILDFGQGSRNAIPAHSDGIAVRTSDWNGNGTGAYITNETYANSFGAMAIVLSQRTAANAQNKIIKSGPFTGMTYYELVEDVIEQYAWSQGDGGNRGGMIYTPSSQNNGFDGSTQNWPPLLTKMAQDRWGIQPEQWYIDNTREGFVRLQYSDGGIGYRSASNRNVARTGGVMVSASIAGITVNDGDTSVDKAMEYVGNYWATAANGGVSTNTGWAGEFYGMYGIKKGLSLGDAQTVRLNGVDRDWYQDMSAWLLGDAALLDSPGAFSPGSGFGGAQSRVASKAFGQNWPTGASSYLGGGWNNGGWISNSAGFATAHAILVLTKSVTVALPIPKIASIPDQSSRNPANITLDGTASTHADPNLSIVTYEWDFDANDGLSWESGSADATGQLVNVFPDYTTGSTNVGEWEPGIYTVTLRVTDNNNPANSATTTTTVSVLDTDVPPIAKPILDAQQPPVYSGRIGDSIVLDGRDSYDPDEDVITAWAWDLDGNGTYGDAADAALDITGNADGPTATLVFNDEYNGTIGLQVTANGKTGTSSSPVDIVASPSDLYVANISSSNIVVGVSADVTAVLASAADSGKDFTGVVVRFYDGDPFTSGSQIGAGYTVDLPIGGMATVVASGLPLNAGQEFVYVFVDATSNVDEYDEANNTAPVNVSNKPPVALAKNVTVSADANCQGVVTAEQVDNGSSDPDGDPITLTLTPAGPYPLGTTEVTLTVTDDGGLSDTATAIITVVDDTAPTVVSSPADEVIECPAVPAFGVPEFTDVCDHDLTVEFSDEDLAVSGKEVTMTKRTWTATDDAGNSVATSQTITVQDTTAPVVTSCPADYVIECPEVPVFGTPVFTDACDQELTVVSSDESLPVSGQQVTQTKRTWTATDDHGNSVSCSQTISVTDNTAPTVVSSPADETIECPAVPVFGMPVFADTCDQELTVASSDESLPVSGQETSKTKRTWTATDDHGNSVSTSQTITVVDTTAPTVVSSPADEIIECPAVPVFGMPVFADTCDQELTVASSDESLPVIGQETRKTKRTWTATDDKGNSVSTSQTITVVDTTAPTVVSSPADEVIECPAVPVFGAPVFTDTCDDELTVVSSDESLPASGKEVTKSKRTWTATDDHGNAISTSQTITVVDTTAPALVSGPVSEIIECPAVPVFGTPEFTDTCDPDLTVVWSDESLPVSGKEVTRTKRTWTATDNNGNAISFSQTITVEDTTAPVITLTGVNPQIIECPQDYEELGATATDTCDTALNAVVIDTSAVDTHVPGDYLVTYNLSDAKGNAAVEVTRIVRVQDTTPPVMTCPAPVCVVSDAGSCDATNVDIGTPVTSDNCEVVSVINDHPSTTYPLGETVVTWTVTDIGGNTATCQQTVTVLASVAVTWRPPLKGQPVGNKINVGQVLPHKVLLEDCTGVTMVSGITVTLRIQGINGATGVVLEDVIEDAQGTGVDGTLTSDGIMVLTDSQWHFNVDTGNFGDTNTLSSDNYYQSTVTVTDNATLKVLGTSSVILETKSRGKK